MTPGTLKATLEAADRATTRGAFGQALRLLLEGPRRPIAPDHDHTCPQCVGGWSHLDEPCRDIAGPEEFHVVPGPRRRGLHEVLVGVAGDAGDLKEVQDIVVV